MAVDIGVRPLFSDFKIRNSVRSSAASGLPTDDRGTPAPFSGNSTQCPGACTTLPLSGFPALSGVPFSLTVYRYISRVGKDFGETLAKNMLVIDLIWSGVH